MEWTNTPKASMPTTEVYEYQCNRQGHRHKITTSEKIPAADRVCKYCGKRLVQITYTNLPDITDLPEPKPEPITTPKIKASVKSRSQKHEITLHAQRSLF